MAFVIGVRSMAADIIMRSGVWTPADIPGLVLWLKADVGTYQDAAKTTPATLENDAIGAWADELTGSGIDCTQAIALRKPKLDLDAQNGLPGIYFSSADLDYLQLSARPNCLTACSFFAVWKPDSDNSYTVYGWHVNEWWLFHGDGNSYMSVGRNARVMWALGMPQVGTHMISILSNVATYQLWIDQVDKGTQAPLFGLGSAVHRLGTLGDLVNGLFNGHMFEFIIYDASLTGGERALVETYLKDRFGI